MANKLNKIDFTMLKDSYLQKMLNRGTSLETIEYYIDKDYQLEEKQKDKMLKALEQDYNNIYYDKIDNILFDVLEALQSPSKWSIDRDGQIITVYPHPVVKNKKVTGMEYKKHSNYYFEDAEILEAYCRLQDEIAEANKPDMRGRSGKKKYSPELISKWVELRTKGYKFAEIARQYKTTGNIVSYQVRKYKAGA